MTDKVDPKTRTEIMRKIRGKDTKLEKLARLNLWECGYRYRKNIQDLPGKPDLVFRKIKTVIFIDSCFWHGCPDHLRMPKSNEDYWKIKINRNKKRDEIVNQEYKKLGWRIIRIWEHDLISSFERTMSKVIKILEKRENLFHIDAYI